MTQRKYALTGERATSRIKWFNPDQIIKHDGRKYVRCFIVYQLMFNGTMKLVSVSSQLGIDMNGRHVLPDSRQMFEDEYAHTSRFSKNCHLIIQELGIAVGYLNEAGEKFVYHVEQHLQQDVSQEFTVVVPNEDGNMLIGWRSLPGRAITCDNYP